MGDIARAIAAEGRAVSDARLGVGPVGDDVPAESTIEEVQEITAFALEAQLRDFLIANLHRVPLAETRVQLYRDSYGRTGREYPTDVGPIDILVTDAGGRFHVIELKLDKGPDRALGQLARYMGWVQANLAGDKEVFGAVVARSIDEKLRLAALVMPNVTLLEYELDFKLAKVAAASRIP